MTDRRGSTTARSVPAKASEQLFDLSQEIDRLNEVGAEHELRVIANNSRGWSTGRSHSPCSRRQKRLARQAAERPMSKGNAIAAYDVAAKHLQIVQACVDRLHDLGATHELKILTRRLQRLALWATPVEPEIVKREQESPA